MTAVRQQIFDEIKRRLTAIDGVQEVKVMPSGDPMKWNAIHIFDGGQGRDDAEILSSRYQMTATVEGYLERVGEDVYSDLNDLYAAVVTKLMPETLGEPPLGGLAETIEEGDLRIVVAELASKPRLAFSLDFQINFPTARSNPAQAA